jgi:hypothetical protein
MPNAQNSDRLVMGYKADDGVTYKILTSANHIAALSTFFIPATDEMPDFPKGWKPRTVHGFQRNDTGRDKRITIVWPDAATVAAIGSIDVPPYGDFEVTGYTGERRSILAPLWDGDAPSATKPAKQRVQIAYTDDIGDVYLVTTSREHAAAVNAPIPVIGTGGGKQLPKGLRPRHYNLLKKDLAGTDKKLRVIEPNRNSAMFKSLAPTEITLSEQGVFLVTGRKDESRSRPAPLAVQGTP